MTTSPETTAEIRRLYFAEHWKRGTIATQLDVHPDVVKRVLGQLGPKFGSKRPAESLLEPHKFFVDQILEQYPRLVATRLYDMLRERGYTGSIRTLRRYVCISRPRKRKAYLDIETLPGEVGEVDWGHVGELAVPSGHRTLWVFVMQLSYSRAAFAELVLSLDAASLRRSLIRASNYFHGSPRAWLFDNAKTVVIERRGSKVRFHSGLVELAGQMHVELRVCDPRAPHQKGAVERCIRYLKERFFAARSVRDLEQGNRQLHVFLQDIANARPHPRKAGRSVGEVFADEQAKLLPLPDHCPPLEMVTPVVVDAKGFVQIDTNRYSVPSTHAHTTLLMATTDTTLRVINGTEEVANHPRSWGYKQTFEQPEHRAQLIAEKRGARNIKGRDRLRTEVPAIELLLERWLDREFNLGSMVARTMKLLDS